MMGFSGLELQIKTPPKGANNQVPCGSASAQVHEGHGAAVTKAGSAREVSMPELKSVIRLCVATAIGLIVSTGFVSAQARARQPQAGSMKYHRPEGSPRNME